MRGLNCCVFILKQLDFVPPKEMDHTYNEEFIEVYETADHGRAISAKLIEPSLVCNIDSVYTLYDGVLVHTTRREFLSKYVNSPLVLMFVKPVKNGSPAILPISTTQTVETDVVRGFFSCLYNMNFDLIHKNNLIQAARRFEEARRLITGGAAVMRDIELHLIGNTSS